MSGVVDAIDTGEWLDAVHRFYEREMPDAESAELFGWEGLPTPVHAAADRDAAIAAGMSQLAHSHHKDS